MLKSEILEKIFSKREMQTIPISCQSTSVHVFEEVLEEMMEENPYAELQSLFISNNKHVSI